MNLLDTKGCPLERQRFTWRDMVGAPISKLDDDAFTRVRIIWMNGQELDSLRKQAEKDRNQLQQQYDRETNHSRVKAKQGEWERKIKSELMQQEYYSSAK